LIRRDRARRNAGSLDRENRHRGDRCRHADSRNGPQAADQRRRDAHAPTRGCRFLIDGSQHLVREGARSNDWPGFAQSLADGGVTAEGLAQFGIALQALQQQIELRRRKFAVQAGRELFVHRIGHVFIHPVTFD
jgi:hypothetical protein